MCPGSQAKENPKTGCFFNSLKMQFQHLKNSPTKHKQLFYKKKKYKWLTNNWKERAQLHLLKN